MIPKKNPKVDLKRNSTTYFLIGLVLVLFLTWRAIELKTYEREIDLDRLSVLQDREEDIPITELKLALPPPPPPPPAVAPQVIEVVEDEEEIEETVIESTETDQEEVIVDVEEIDVEEEEEEVIVPFAIIEDIPIFPGCEKVSKKKQRDCFQKQINKHILSNFRYPEIAQEMGVQGKVYVSFVIDRQGNIVGVTARGPDKNLEKEGKRIIEKLPRMIPGKQRGKPVKVPYSIPITFKLQ